MDANHGRPAPRHQLILRKALGHVVSIDAVQATGEQTPPRDSPHERVVEDDVDVGRQDEPSARSPNADVLGDHLEERERIRMLESRVQLVGDFDDSDVAPTAALRPREDVAKERSAEGWVPLHDDQLTAKLVTQTLLR